MTPAGQMNRRVQIMRLGGTTGTVTTDTAGQPIDAGSAGWSQVRNPWAKIEPQATGKTAQTFGTGEFTSKLQVWITIRWSVKDRITSADRVVYTEPGSGLVHTFNVQDVVNVAQKNEDLLLICEEIDGGG